jgi:peptidoglycan/LPS O-acetylase OafA/YrhL
MSTDDKPRIPALDGIRGLAILLVLAWHYGQNQLHPESGFVIASIKKLLGFTWSGVDLFFVLSGFLIAGILLDNRASPRYFTTFYVRRTCRIFPIYYLNIAIFFILYLLAVDDAWPLDRLFMSADIPGWSYLTFTQNIYMGLEGTGASGWLAITWSLAVEEQFYLLLPVLIRFVPAHALPYLFMWLILSAVALRATYPGLVAYINMPWRADALLLGALIAWAVRDRVLLERLNTTRAWWGPIAATLAIAVIITGWSGRLVLGGPITHFAIAVMYASFMMVPILSPDGVVSRLLSTSWIRWLGTISYAVFLVHIPVSGFVHYFLRNDYPGIAGWQDALVTVAALLLTLFVAQLSYWLVERRIIALGHRVRY